MKTAKVFKHGNSQAVRLPKEFRFADDEVLINRLKRAEPAAPAAPAGPPRQEVLLEEIRDLLKK